MFRHSAFRWSLVAAVLLVIGLWPAAVAPIAIAFAGAATVIAAIPGQLLLLAAGIAYLRYRPAPAKPATA